MNLNGSRSVFQQLQLAGLLACTSDTSILSFGDYVNKDGLILRLSCSEEKYGSGLQNLISMAHPIMVEGLELSDPIITFAIQYSAYKVIPVAYANELLRHSETVFANGSMDLDKAAWLLKVMSNWLTQVIADGYHKVHQPGFNNLDEKQRGRMGV